MLTKKINLGESLTGLDFNIKHLDDRIMKIKVDNEIISPNMFKVINNEGMPIMGKFNEFGKLLIKFEVIFPNKLPISKINMLKQIFPEKYNDKFSTNSNQEISKIAELNNIRLKHVKKMIKQNEKVFENMKNNVNECVQM